MANLLSWMGNFKRSREKCVVFFTFDFSLACIRSFTSQDFQALLNFLAPITPEIRGKQVELSDEAEVLAFIERCLDGKIIRHVDVLAIETFDSRALESEFKTAKWVKSSKTICDAALSNAYSYVLNGLRQSIMIQLDPRFKDIWRTVPITLGPPVPYAYDPGEPINQATYRAAQMGTTVIVAAGNEGKIVRGNSLNPWSVAPWVIGVGAADAQGTHLLDISSRGTASIPDLGPTVVAPAMAESWAGALGHGHAVAAHFTEEAPPGAVDIAIVGEHVFLYRKDQSGRVSVHAIQGGVVGPEVPLATVRATVEANQKRLQTQLKGTSFAAEYIASLCPSIVKTLVRLRNDIAIETRPKLLKVVLEDMARPVAGYNRWEIGSGLVTKAIAEDYLSRLTSSDLARLYSRAATRW